jgi:predicted ArsR family transcriptional regulator
MELIKRLGPSTARRLAAGLGTTDVAVRQHLVVLENAGLVRSMPDPPTGRGRPAVRWSLTAEAGSLFPDRHGELAVGLVEAIRESVGERGLMRIVEVRARDQVNVYQRLMPPPSASLKG